jgi:ribosomal protein L13E
VHGAEFHATQSACVASNSVICGVLEREDAMWNRRDWDDFFDIVMKRSRMQRPPRPLDRSGRSRRLVPAEGYSLAELDDAGLSIEQAEVLGLPVDAGRVGAYGPNTTALREYVRATRSRL